MWGFFCCCFFLSFFFIPAINKLNLDKTDLQIGKQIKKICQNHYLTNVPIKYTIPDLYILMTGVPLLQENYTTAATTKTCDTDAPDGRTIFFLIIIHVLFLSSLPTVLLVDFVGE